MSALLAAAPTASETAAEDADERALEVRLQLVTRVRGIYQAARRTMRLVHAYRAECLVRREDWRSDSRIIACLEQVAAYRQTIRALRAKASAARFWPMTHGCGAVISAEEWPTLSYAGRWQLNADDPPAEQRACPRCRSHVTVPLANLPGAAS